MSDIPEWAYGRACVLYEEFCGGTGTTSLQYSSYGYMKGAFAKYIAEHEEPPTDPLLVEARDIAATDMDQNPVDDGTYAEEIRDGLHDNSDAVRPVLKALKRGIEIGKE